MELLRGRMVYLKLIEEEDMLLRAQWINDPDIQATLNYDIPTSVSKTKAWFNKVQMDNTRREFSIFVCEDNRYIGFCGLFNIQIPVMKCEYHCVIGDIAYKGQGYGTEAQKLLINYGFAELGMNRIYGYQRVHNLAAHRVTEKLGWQREGLLRQDVFSHGSLHDRYIVSILREDWMRLGIYQHFSGGGGQSSRLGICIRFPHTFAQPLDGKVVERVCAA